MRDEGGGRRDEGRRMRDEEGGMISGQAFTPFPVMLVAVCLALGLSPALWPGVLRGWLSGSCIYL